MHMWHVAIIQPTAATCFHVPVCPRRRLHLIRFLSIKQTSVCSVQTPSADFFNKGDLKADVNSQVIFYRAMLCIRGTSHGPVSVCLCLSVCLSVTSRCSTKTAKQRITQTAPHDTPKDSSVLMLKISAKFDRGHPLRGRQTQVGWVKIGDFRQISGYISKTVQDRHIVSIKVE